MTTTFSATYSPDDNKLRLYASSRLDAETFARVKAAGFKWAPKQELFVAPMWTPSREDLLIELAGEIDDEDKSLVERAEERADRFEDYSDKRMSDAENARRAVERIADGIPLGQPILVGHHSERHARRDAEKIENGMRKAVKMWETSNYWTSRAEGAIRAAKYKELPGVRHRRIKGLESDRRKIERNIAEYERLQVRWFAENISAEQVGEWLDAGYNYDMQKEFKSGAATAAEIIERVRNGYTRAIANSRRWLAHYCNRLAYENAMLAEQLGVAADAADPMGTRFDFKAGGKVQIRHGDEWLTVLRVNKTAGKVSSLTTTAPQSVTWSKTWKTDVERIRNYQAPSDEDAAKAKAAAKLPPLCNYPGEGFREMTEEEWTKRHKWTDFSYIATVAENGETGRHRVRQMPVPGKMWQKQRVYITDGKRVDPPRLAPKPGEEAPAIDTPEPVESEAALEPVAELVESVAEAAAPLPVMVAESYQEPPAPANDPFQAMRDSLRAGGVKVTIAAQLFPTPRELAARMVEEACLKPGARILEPEAGTGRLLDAAIGSDWQGEAVAVEINPALAQALLSKYQGAVKVHHGNFLETGPELLGLFDVVLMNPPFADRADVFHVKHAAQFLKPGGRLVAIMSAGVTFRGDRIGEEFRAFVESRGGTIEPLPADTFKESGTAVNSVLVVIDGK